jgi:hypothetical protein
LTEEDVDGDHLVERSGGETVGPGEIDQEDGGTIPFDQSGFLFDGDAGEVADSRLATGEGVEESALAGVGVAEKGHLERCRLVPRLAPRFTDCHPKLSSKTSFITLWCVEFQGEFHTFEQTQPGDETDSALRIDDSNSQLSRTTRCASLIRKDKR